MKISAQTKVERLVKGDITQSDLIWLLWNYAL